MQHFMGIDWGQWVDDDTAARRAGGRRAYNFRRKDRAILRRHALERLFTYNHGDITRVAAALGVSRWTIWRDMKALGMDVHGAWRLLGSRHEPRYRPERRG